MLIAIEDYPPVAFKLGTSQTKTDREWLKKKKEYYEKVWSKSGQRILGKIEDACGEAFTSTAKQSGITVLLSKKTQKSRSGLLKQENPLEISLFLTKNDTSNTLKELLVRMLVHSFIWQQYEFHFRVREQTLFEDILADEFSTAMISLVVLGRKPTKANCAEALDRAVEETVDRLSQKTPRSRLVDALFKSFQDYPDKIRKGNADILVCREELIEELLQFLPKTEEAAGT
ncbi:MAG: hypothetical protein NWE93_06430 [Candidatus Bathyarchaeota archaeon]|nr:hypothetical protein [Candidatus Bathyarchaeota archaeon]